LNNLQDFVDLYAEPDQTLKADGFDDAILGIDSKQRMVYSIEKILEILQKDDMSEEDALEHFYYNIEGSYVGDYTPLYIFEYGGTYAKQK
tara:strand:+ start:454 stop:723 length:270 start_codon:yes stop_codon:yes gene_type:complete